MPFLGFDPNTSTTGASNTIADTTTIGDGTAEDVQIRFDGANIHYHIGLDDSADRLTFGKGDTLGASNTRFLQFDTDGIIAKPLLPFVHAYNSANDDNVAHNTTHKIEMDADFFDQNGDFNNTNDVFTAPVTGKYWINGHVGLTDLDEDANYWQVRLVTSNGYFWWADDPKSYNPPVDLLDCRISIGICVDMDSGDTAHLDFFTSGGSNQVDIFGNNSTALAGQQSYMTVYLVA